MEKIGKFGLHLAFWIFFSIIPRLLSPPAFHLELYFFVTLFIDAINFYIFYLFFIPRYFNKEFRRQVFLWSVLIIFIIIASRIGLSNQILKSNAEIYKQLIKSPILFVLKEVIGTLLFIVYPVLLTFTERYFELQKAKVELIEQKRESELSLLKSQINPHFFFNTLNNIYSLVYSGSPDAHKAVMKLSELMRYNLYKSNTDRVLLEIEIAYLNTFTELELLRIKDKNFIKMETSGDIHGIKIAPMILVPFVENAYKHCERNANPPGIDIKIKVIKNTLFFTVVNEIGLLKEKSNNNDSGIGLVNVKKRLDLIYPNQHILSIDKKDNKFFVDLAINL